MQKALLEEFAPAAVLIDQHFRVLCQYGAIGSFLEFQSGEPTHDLPSLVRQGLRARLRSVVQRALQAEAKSVEEPAAASSATANMSAA